MTTEISCPNTGCGNNKDGICTSKKMLMQLMSIQGHSKKRLIAVCTDGLTDG